VRSALIWLGKEDPVKTQAVARVDDPVRKSVGAMLLAWATVMGLGFKHRCKLQDVVDAANDRDPSGAPVWPDLFAAVQGTMIGSQQPDANSLGQWIRHQKGRIIDGLTFDSLSNPKGGSLWWVNDGSGANDRKGTEKPGERSTGGEPTMQLMGEHRS
jgi:hypothetical protein